jgi:hypothetical protein
MCTRDWGRAPIPHAHAQVAAQVLRHSAAVIERGWTSNTGTTARDRNGREVSAFAPEATSWCALGAVKKTTRELGVEWTRTGEALSALGCHLGMDPQEFNNTRATSGDEVVEAMLIAAEALEAGDFRDHDDHNDRDPWRPGVGGGRRVKRNSPDAVIPAVLTWSSTVVFPSTVVEPGQLKLLAA